MNAQLVVTASVLLRLAVGEAGMEANVTVPSLPPGCGIVY